MKTLDLKKELKPYYAPPTKEPTIIQIPCFQFAVIDGAIERGSAPGTSPGFQQATEALYSLSYTLKFMLKKRKEDPIDYPVLALEGLWWVEDGYFDITVKDNWLYTLMIQQPRVITLELFREALAQVKKKRGETEALCQVRLADFEEGLCVQMMHIGPYASEPTTIDAMRRFVEGNGFRDSVGLGGKHHEIYLSDPRKAQPSRMKTVLRHPIERQR